jgi:hypothetical protein
VLLRVLLRVQLQVLLQVLLRVLLQVLLRPTRTSTLPLQPRMLRPAPPRRTRPATPQLAPEHRPSRLRCPRLLRPSSDQDWPEPQRELVASAKR